MFIVHNGRRGVVGEKKRDDKNWFEDATDEEGNIIYSTEICSRLPPLLCIIVELTVKNQPNQGIQGRYGGVKTGRNFGKKIHLVGRCHIFRGRCCMLNCDV